MNATVDNLWALAGLPIAYEQHRNDAIRAGILLREFDNARRTLRRSPGGSSCTCSACSATARFGWGEQRKAHVDADVALPAHRAMSMLLSTI
jgi:hypothetical protein